MFYYFYDNKTKLINDQEHFIIYRVLMNDKISIDEAERKARTIAKERKSKLAGGMFSDNYKPYNLKTNYKIIIVPKDTKISPLTKKDKFIINLIEYENNLEYEIF